MSKGILLLWNTFYIVIVKVVGSIVGHIVYLKD
jgi:hypothetical protein